MGSGRWLPRLEPRDRPHAFGGSNDETGRSLENLRVANRYLGGARSLLQPVCRLLRSHPGGPVRVVDVGCGGADVARALVAWARRHDVRLQITAVDQDAVVIDRARRACQAWPEIRVVRGDAARLPFPERSVDYVISSMLLHYFGSAQAAVVLGGWRALATRAVVVADVERHWFPCLALRLLGRVSANPLFRESHGDTIRRGFTPLELERLGMQAGFSRVGIRRHRPFRLSLVGLR